LLAKIERTYCQFAGVRDPAVAKRIVEQSILLRKFGEPDSFNWGNPDAEGFASLGEFGPNNILESMLAVQMSGAHEAALAFLKASGEPGLSQRQRDAEVRRAKQLMQLFNSQMEKMMKLKNQEWGERAPSKTTSGTFPRWMKR
jgi:hypothetical protein